MFLIIRKVLDAVLLDSDSELSESSTDEGSDVELLLCCSDSKVHNIKMFYEKTIPSYSVDEFKSHFRMTRTSLQMVFTDLQESHLSIKGRPSVPMEKALLMTIWTLANTECFRTIGDRFGVERGHCHRIVLNTCKDLSKLKKKYIVWPKGISALSNVEDFNNLRGRNSFPNVFACVDGTHILIPGSTSDNSYYNRKGTHSVIVQLICGPNQEFLNISCGWPGSYHDARVWKNSLIYQKLKDDTENWLPKNTYLLGDSAYPLDTFIMVPFRDNGHLTQQQKIFNKKLSSTRVIIENSIGLLKGLFRRLKFLNVANMCNAKYIILSSCVLHNISIKDRIIPQEDLDVIDDNLPADGHDAVDVEEANQLRNSIMQQIC